MDNATKRIQDLRNSAYASFEPAMTAADTAVFEAALTAWMGQVSSDAQLHRLNAELTAGNADDLMAELWESSETVQTINSAVSWVVYKLDAKFAVEEGKN